MGNWRRAHILGTCDVADVARLHQLLAAPVTDPAWGCLHCGGLMGLRNWAAARIDTFGNLAERNYTPQDVAKALLACIAAAPSLRVMVHVGRPFEAAQCEATVVAWAQGKVYVGPPGVRTLPPARGTRPITVEVSFEDFARLELLVGNEDNHGCVEDVVGHLVQSAADGIRRPGAWERGWLLQAFAGEDKLPTEYSPR